MNTTLPDSKDIEENLISVCLLDDGQSLGKCLLGGVSPVHFTTRPNQIVFEALLALHAKGVPCDLITLVEHLRPSGELEKAGGIPYLTQVSSAQSTTIHTAFLIDRLLELHTRRLLTQSAFELIESCKSGDYEEMVLPKVGRLSSLVNGRASIRTWKQAVDEAEALTRERIKPVSERNTGGMEISWGLADFDRYFQPLEPGELVVIGGYTSSGKSSLLRQVLWNGAAIGHAVMLQTIEVRDAEEAVNLAGHISGVRSRHNLENLHSKDREDLMAAFPKMRVPHFTVSHQDHNLGAMIARARSFKSQHGLRIFGVDYLQILEDVKKLRRDERPDFAIGCVTSELKRFATAENCVVFLLSGFNRAYVRDGNREPRLSDLDGSSSIEKDASRVILLDVPVEYKLGGVSYEQNLTANALDQPRFFTKAIQAKGRNTGTATVGLYFHRETKTFKQIKPYGQ